MITERVETFCLFVCSGVSTVTEGTLLLSSLMKFLVLCCSDKVDDASRNNRRKSRFD